MKKTFQSFVFGCRVNEAERIKIDKELVEAGYSIDLASPSFLIINTCAITGKAEREAKQLIYQLRKQHPEAKLVVTGCSATVWKKYQTSEAKLADIIVPNEQKSRLVSLLLAHRSLSEGGADPQSAKAKHATDPLVTEAVNKGPVTLTQGDKFRYSNRLLVKIQDGCHRFCSYCIVPYLRGLPQSQTVASLIEYIQSFKPTPSEVVLSAINTEAFGVDSKETFIDLLRRTLSDTLVPRLALGSVHPWSLTNEFLNYYASELSKNKRFVHFFHVPVQSGSQAVLKLMKREYQIADVLKQLTKLKSINQDALIATDVIVGFLGETDELFEETYERLKDSPISRFHVFRFSNRPHTAAFYMKKNGNYSLDPGLRRDDAKNKTAIEKILFEPTAEQKKIRANRLIALSKDKYNSFLETQIGRTSDALVIAAIKDGYKILFDNHIEGILKAKDCLPGQIRRVTILAAKDGIVTCQDS